MYGIERTKQEIETRNRNKKQKQEIETIKFNLIKKRLSL